MCAQFIYTETIYDFFFRGLRFLRSHIREHYVGVTAVCRIFVDVMWENLLRVTGDNFDYNQPVVHYMFTGLSFLFEDDLQKTSIFNSTSLGEELLEAKTIALVLFFLCVCVCF